MKQKNKIMKPIIPQEERRRIFNLKHLQLERRRLALINSIRRDEAEVKRLADTENAKKKIKKLAKSLAYRTKYIYVAGGHFKNEVLGFLTVFNLGRSHSVRVTRLLRYDAKNPALYLDIYQRKDRDMSKKAKVFVYVHGGGWIGGYPITREGFTTKVAEAGYFVASIRYGDGPKYAHPAMIENVFKAIGWLKDNAEKYNIDMDSIFMGGESAGGHLSAMAGAIVTNPEYAERFKNIDPKLKEQRIEGLVLNCGVYDVEKTAQSGFRNVDVYTQSYCGGVPISELSDEMKKEISPIYWTTDKFPPTFAISAENDKVAVLTFDLVEKLYELGVPLEQYHGEGKWAVHAFAVLQCFKISKEAMSGALSFLAQLQKDKAQ